MKILDLGKNKIKLVGQNKAEIEMKEAGTLTGNFVRFSRENYSLVNHIRASSPYKTAPFKERFQEKIFPIMLNTLIKSSLAKWRIVWW